MSNFIDHSTEFMAKVHIFGDTMMGLMAAGIEAQIKTSGKVPLLPKSTRHAQRGALRASIRHTKLALGKYAITAGTNSPAASYAAAQEAGVTRGHVMKRYSTPGTGPHWFQDGITVIKGRSAEYAMAAKKAVGLENI